MSFKHYINYIRLIKVWTQYKLKIKIDHKNIEIAWQKAYKYEVKIYDAGK